MKKVIIPSILTILIVISIYFLYTNKININNDNSQKSKLINSISQIGEVDVSVVDEIDFTTYDGSYSECQYNRDFLLVGGKYAANDLLKSYTEYLNKIGWKQKGPQSLDSKFLINDNVSISIEIYQSSMNLRFDEDYFRIQKNHKGVLLMIITYTIPSSTCKYINK